MMIIKSIMIEMQNTKDVSTLATLVSVAMAKPTKKGDKVILRINGEHGRILNKNMIKHGLGGVWHSDAIGSLEYFCEGEKCVGPGPKGPLERAVDAIIKG